MPTGTQPLPGGPTQPGMGPYGGVPTVPNPSGTQQDVLLGNIGNLGNIYQLGQGLNQFTNTQAADALKLNLPNYQNMINQSSANNLSLLKGQIPTDVKNLIAQNAAERGVMTGSIGSDNSNAALLRALGLTSLGLEQQGETNLSGAVARTPVGQQFDPNTMLNNPQFQQLMQYLANVLKTAPTPGAGDRLNLNELLAGLRAGGGTGGGGPRGGGGPPGADFFGNIYTPPGGGGGGTIVGYGPGGGPGVTTPGSTITRSNQWGLGTAGEPLGTIDTDTSSIYNPLAGFGNFFGAGGTAGGGIPGTGTTYFSPPDQPAAGDWTYDLGGGSDWANYGTIP